MKSLFIVLSFCFIFAPILNTVHGSTEGTETKSGETVIDVFYELSRELDDHGANINGVLQISESSFLGEGGYGVVYSGVRISDSKPVAIKFSPEYKLESAEREYAIYSYLHAIDNPAVERFGIPSVYYYAKWRNFIVMAITLCEDSLSDRRNDFNTPLNALIIFQQFVRQSKYIHSCGIRHDDIKPGNMLIKSYQSFLIDYNMGSEMNDDTHICTYRYKPRRSHFTDEIRKAVDDWESFFYGMAQLCNVPLKWFSGDKYKNLSEQELNYMYGKAKRDVQDIVNKVKAIESPPLRKVFVAFAREIFSEDAANFPKYDFMDKYISTQIKTLVEPNQPVFFTWMDRKDVKEALKHIRKNPIPNIETEIMDPRLFNFNYPHVDVNHFNGTAPASSSGDNKRKFAEV